MSLEIRYEKRPCGSLTVDGVVVKWLVFGTEVVRVIGIRWRPKNPSTQAKLIYYMAGHEILLDRELQC